MPDGLDLLVIFAVMLTGLLIGAGILQAACVLDSKLGKDADQPSPGSNGRAQGGIVKLSFGQSLAIIFVTGAIHGVADFLVARMLRGPRVAPSLGAWLASPLAYFLTLPVSIPVIGVMLPTHFSKGLRVALLCVLFWLAIVVVVFMIAMSVAGRHSLGA